MSSWRGSACANSADGWSGVSQGCVVCIRPETGLSGLRIAGRLTIPSGGGESLPIKAYGTGLGCCAILATALLAGLGASAAGSAADSLLQGFERPDALFNTAKEGVATSLEGTTRWGHSCLKVVVPAGFAWQRSDTAAPLDAVRVAVLAPPGLPPEADAIRMQVKLEAGAAILAVGSPVSQMGNSDVLCDPQLLPAGREGWQTIECSLNHHLIRNYRRPNFTAALPVIYYSRWMQEPLYLYLVSLPGSLRPAGETRLLVDQVEWVAKGEGHPFPRFDKAALRSLSTLAEFTTPASLSNACLLAHGYSYIDSIRASYEGTGKVRYPPLQFSWKPGAGGKGGYLQAEGAWEEEGPVILFKTSGNPQANAMTLDLRPAFPKALPRYTFEREGGRFQAIDLVVLVAPAGKPFPWPDLAISSELRRAMEARHAPGGEPRFDYLLTTTRNTVAATGDIRQAGAFAFYSTRRHVPVDSWSSLVVPLADFICVYGQGECEARMKRQLPLDAREIAAVGVLAPFGSGRGTLSVGKLAYATLPAAGQAARSFWQVPDMDKVQLTPLSRFRSSGGWAEMLPSGELPADYLREGGSTR